MKLISLLGDLVAKLKRTIQGRKQETDYFQFYDGEKMGMQTVEGRLIIPAVYDFVEPFSDGLFHVSQDNLHAYFDAEGKIVIPFQDHYESYGNFTEGLARVKIDEKWGYIDKQAKEVITPEYFFANEFSNGRAIVRNSNDKHGAIDKTGKLVIDYQFDLLTDFENGHAKFGDHKTYGLIDRSGKIVVPQEYVYIGSVENNSVKVQIREGENYREGLLTIGGIVEWNTNLDGVNAFNLQRKEFIRLAEGLVRTMYADGCPCSYERFRHFIEWDKPVSFMDQQELFFVFSKFLDKTENATLECKTCGTAYSQKLDEYSIYLQVLNVRITEKGDFTEKGAGLQRTVPVSLGFQGYDLDKLREVYDQTDNETVMNYLEERGSAAV